jgi:hypothetical protein
MMRRRLQSPEFVVMGALAALCGLFVALLLSAEFGSQSSGGEAALRTTQTPAPNLARLRQAAARAKPTQKHHRAKRNRPSAVKTAALKPVAQVQAPTTNNAQTDQGQASPVQQLSTPSNPAPAPAPVKQQTRPQPSGGGGHHTSTSFDDSG